MHRGHGQAQTLTPEMDREGDARGRAACRLGEHADWIAPGRVTAFEPLAPRRRAGWVSTPAGSRPGGGLRSCRARGRPQLLLGTTGRASCCSGLLGGRACARDYWADAGEGE